MKQIEHGCGKDGLIRKTGKKEGITTDMRRMGTNEEKTLNRRKRRLAAKERRERNRSEMFSARSEGSEKLCVGGRLEEGFGGKRLCSITRIYTYLHAFTRFYTKFLAVTL